METKTINLNNSQELEKFKKEISGFMADYGFPYRLDDFTEKGGNYTIFCPVRWKNAFSPAKLHKILRNEVDADKIKVEYINFVKEDQPKAQKKKDILLPIKEVCRWMRDNHIHYPNEQIPTEIVIQHFREDMGDKL